MENTTARAISNETTQHNFDPCYHLAIDDGGFTTVASKVNAALNVSVAVIAAIANALVFPAIRKSNALRPPSKLLLCNLVVTDVAVALMAQPLYVHYLLVKQSQGFSRSSCSLISFGAVAGATLTFVSLETMSAISIDRYIAFKFHLRYRETVTAKRVCAVIGMIWLSAVLNVQTWLWNINLYSILVFVNVPLHLLVTSLAYISIYRGLRRCHGQKFQDQAKARNQQRTASDIAQYRRTASNMMWLYGIFILCYMPYVCTETVDKFWDTFFVTNLIEFAITITYLNSCLNPFVYCLRLPEIRAAVLLRIRRIFE